MLVSVAPGGLGEELGLRAGDRLLSINDHSLRDVIDVWFYGAEEKVTLGLERDGAILTLCGPAGCGRDWGVEFAESLFDGIRECGNRCPFCYLVGLPPGLRPSLYQRDDDYRLSFLSGSFVTLTNLEEGDWQRLAEQRLSPLYVSVQATEPDLRRRLLGGGPIPDILQQIRRLGEMRISVEVQVVVCPGLNDGPALERTVADLWQQRETVESVALVPVGLSCHHPARLHPVTPALARDMLAFADGWRRSADRQTGRRFLYPSDEVYLLAGRPVPGATAYDGFPQLANGVGLVRRFLDDWRRTERRLQQRSVRPAVQSATMVSGQAFLPFLEEVARGLGSLMGVRCWAEGVLNRLLGESVTVAGLLSGRDVAEQLAQRELGAVVILPRSMLDASGERTLDDWTPADLAAALGRQIALAELPRDLAAILQGQA
jgi:putative radical SAM enzyme (TIGR03279 family)